jgi:CHAD domain-containing protein
MARAKPITGIDCGRYAIEAIGSVLITRMEEMCAFRDRALDSSDPEGVHDMRVSSRRLRGALSDFAPYLGKRSLANAEKQITILADALGEVRDQDVAIAGLEKLAARAPDEAAAPLNHFVKVRVGIRNKARRDLRRLLRMTALKQLQKDFAEEIETVVNKAKTRSNRPKKPKAADVSYEEIARSIVIERLVELEKLSSGFYHPLKPKPLHKLRIGAKHLRYALELFEQCLGPEAAVFAKKIAGLQTSLGELHDCDVWIETFGQDLQTATREASKNRISGSLWLLSHFVRLHSKHLRNALARWEEWELSDSGNQLRALVKDTAQLQNRERQRADIATQPADNSLVAL